MIDTPPAGVRTKVPFITDEHKFVVKTTCTAPTTAPLRSLTLIETTPLVARLFRWVFRQLSPFTVTVFSHSQNRAIAFGYDKRHDF